MACNAGTISGNQEILVGQTTQFSSDGDIGGVWLSNNTSIAVVNNNGLVTSIYAGKAVISYTVTSEDCSSTAKRDVIVSF